MELLLKLVVGGLAAAVCATVLRRSTPEFAVLLALACGTWIVFMLAQTVGENVGALVRLAGAAKLDARMVEPVVKVVGLSIVTRIGTELCKSAGEGGIAALVEIAGTLLALAAALPLVERVLALVTELLP